MKAEKIIPEVDHNTPWKLTDPDNFQYGRQVSLGVFQFKEFNRNDYSFENPEHYEDKQEFIDTVFDNPVFWEEDTIVLANFNEHEIREHISTYYDSLEQLQEIYGDEWEWIVAECIFEQQSGLY